MEYKVKDAEDSTYAAAVPTNAGSYTVRFSVAPTYNYSGLSVEKDLTILPKTIDIIWGSTTFTYNGSEQCPTATADGLEDGDTCPITVTGEQTDAGDYTATASIDSKNYQLPTENTASFSIAKRVVTAAPKDVTIIRGSSVPAFELTYTGLLGEDTLSPSDVPTFTCFEADGVTAVSTNTTAGSYTITWSNTDIFDDEINYKVVPATGTLTVKIPDPVAPTYPPVVEQPDEGGSVTASTDYPTAGSKVIITPKPEEGYEVGRVVVTDQDGNPVKVTDNGDGTYSFIQPEGNVTVKVAFIDKSNVSFVDVPATAYCYDAVKWAVKNGITYGTSDTAFSPNAPCTRAQMASFLWRSAGCPEPEGKSSFTDVAPDAYYAKAVAWAVENGITEGVGDNKFAPDAACTRGQMAAFLCRMAGRKAVGSKVTFTDVSADMYYAEAVQWAVENGITDGVGNNRFAPDSVCTRGQMMTFLYRFFVK